MKLSLPRVWIASIATAALAACGGQSTVPHALQVVSAPNLEANGTSLSPSASLSSNAMRPDAKSPCKISGFWYFKGTCVDAGITSAGGKLALAAYKGIAVTLTFPKLDAAKGSRFLVGDGTGSTDITGSFKNLKFPDFGTVPCVTLAGSITKCVGKGFLYILLLNNSKATIVFKGLPAATITSAKFPGITCTADQIAFSNTGNAGWFVLPDTGKVKNGSVAVPGQKVSLSFAVGTFTVLGFSCK